MTIWADTVDVADAETHLRELLQAIKAGAEIALVEGDEIVARLVPPSGNPNTRAPGLHMGAMQPADDFDDPLDDNFWLPES